MDVEQLTEGNPAVVLPFEKKGEYYIEDVGEPERKLFYSIVKRGFDIFVSVFALLVLAIPMLIIAVIIWMDDHGPVLYIHQRIGKNGKKFPLLKFRTMHVNAEEMIREFSSEQKKEWEENFKLEKDPRVTRVGRFLRRSSLDELPQLFNILKGELSIVGERGIIETTKKNIGFSRVVAVNSISS